MVGRATGCASRAGCGILLAGTDEGRWRATFTSTLRRHREVPEAQAEGATVREVLDRVFVKDPLLRSYVLDDQGRLRRHVNVYLDGAMIADRARLSGPAGPDAQIRVLQALSGG